VDPAANLKGRIFVDDDGTVHDAMLNLVDVSKNSDKYYILQVITSVP
jgi:uracil-DNA glycosylase